MNIPVYNWKSNDVIVPNKVTLFGYLPTYYQWPFLFLLSLPTNGKGHILILFEFVNLEIHLCSDQNELWLENADVVNKY